MIHEYKLQQFQQQIWDYYRHNGRPFAWRETRNPYHIVVSEIMLQQTQTHRVVDKFEQFIGAFGTFEMLAEASLREVLSVWQGLGYNRRGIALHKIAQKVVQEHNGILPNDPEILVEFPGIGPATASSICAFAFNAPTVFIETNIRAVYIHFFFQGRDDVHDKEIMPLVAQTVDSVNAREWYYALMDYGVMLKKQYKNPSRKSVHHTQQSKFEGSHRQVRGLVVKLLTEHERISCDNLVNILQEQLAQHKHDHTLIHDILKQLEQEKIITGNNNYYSII